MLEYPISIRLVKKINFKFSYKLLRGAKRIYCKDYNTDIPLRISIEKLKEVPYNSSVTVLIKYRGNFYWCPQFEQCYKDYKGAKDLQEASRNYMIIQSTMTLKTTYPTLKFTVNRVKYETNDVKKIIISEDL